jgi:hypothetical protein
MVLVRVSPTGGDIFPHWISVFTGCSCSSLSVNFCRHTPPFICWTFSFGIPKRQPEDVGRTKLSIPCATGLSDFYEA